jgi:hypothetical protein
MFDNYIRVLKVFWLITAGIVFNGFRRLYFNLINTSFNLWILASRLDRDCFPLKLSILSGTYTVS